LISGGMWAGGGHFTRLKYSCKVKVTKESITTCGT
jgi:hypothetical protein